MPFFAVEGEEVHEVAVGPVHAGVIEPGHFRFNCHGERVLNLEISLGFQHRGVERALLGGPDARTIHLVETLAGDSTVAHATAYCQAVEALSGVAAPHRADSLRAVALELERLANHVGDLGALAGDVAFLPTAAYCGRLRGDILNLTALLCGSRFGRGMVRPGGVRFDAEPDRIAALVDRLDETLGDVRNAVELMFGEPSVQGRFEDTGVVTAAQAVEIGHGRPRGASLGPRARRPSGVPLGHLSLRPAPRLDLAQRRRVRPRLGAVARSAAVGGVRPRPARGPAGGGVPRGGRTPWRRTR